ncbi:MAG: flagellar hook-basal body complex protein, partial [Pseudomonadota bacterium]
NRLQTNGAAMNVAQLGLPTATATTLETSGAPTPFDFSANTESTLSAGQNIVGFNFTGAANSTFQVQMSGSSITSENTTATVTLSSNITTLQELINDIRIDLAGTGIGVDVREDPLNVGRLQFYAVNAGENSTITIDPSDNASLGVGVTQNDIEAVLGGIALGQGGAAGASNVAPDPFGGTPTTGAVGNLSSASFDVSLTGSSGNNGTATVTLNNNVADANDLIADIEEELLASGLSVGVQLDPADNTRIQFFSTVPGESSTITIGNLDASNIGVTQTDLSDALNLSSGVSIPGIAAASNGYVAQSIDVTYPDGSVVTVTTPEDATAAQIAGAFSAASVPDVRATASTTAIVESAGFNNASGTLAMTINGVAVSGSTLADIATEINNGLAGLGTVIANIDTNGDLIVTDQIGNDVVFAITGDVADSIDVRGNQGQAVTLDTTGTSVAAVGGTLELTMSEGISLENAFPAVTNVFGVLNDSAYTEFTLNSFDPSNQETYNAATSLTIYDSLGNPHVLSLFFVKERFTPGVPGEEENRWSVYTLIDGQDVGDPDLNLPPPQDQLATRSRSRVQFNTDGSLNASGSEPILISNWTPLDAEGNPNGAVGPLNILSGGGLPIPQPPNSSNFELRLNGSTQYGRDFALGSIEQDGFATGRLSGLAIDEEGIVLARFTNGQNATLGQVAVADFTNTQGLSAVGDTSWIETSQSGPPLIAAPGSGSLGSISAGALEESNVELSEQLVQLIIAQRNFQANSRTISTSDEITQTIINI